MAMMGLVPMVVVLVLTSPGLVSRDAELHTDELEALRWWILPHGFVMDMVLGMTRARHRFDAVIGVPGRLSALGGTKKWRYFCW